MDHKEAIDTMASERYLIGDLSPQLRDAFEAHLFDCQQCALDTRVGAVFIDHAKVLLPALDSQPAPAPRPLSLKSPTKRSWFAWLRPVILAPAFALLLGIVTFQNVVTYPAMQSAAKEPRLLPTATLLGATRGGHPVVQTDSRDGGSLLVNLPQDVIYASYVIDLYDAQGKQVWSHSAPSSGSSDGAWSLWLPGGVFSQGSYRLAVSGVTSTGEVVSIQQSLFDLQLTK